MTGLIERYRERLPFAADDPVISLQEGSTPLVLAPRISERAGVEVWLKLEGTNPTGSFKDRGMTCAVSDAVRAGAETVICASTGNTAARWPPTRRAPGIGGAVIVPEGKIAAGKLAQALMHGARVVALRGNFDEALKLVRELAQRHPIALVNSVNPFRLEGQKTAAFELLEELGPERPSTRCASRSATPATSPPTGRASASPASRRACSASRRPARRPWSTARRSRSPRPSPARSASATRRAGRRR